MILLDRAFKWERVATVCSEAPAGGIVNLYLNENQTRGSFLVG
jgi:hypothetical protein